MLALNSPQLLKKDSNFIQLGLSESSYPASPKVLKSIYDTIPIVNRYPQTNSDRLRKEIAKYTGTNSSQIIVGNGSDDIIELIIKVLVQQNENILIPLPNFPWYFYASQNLCRNHIFIPSRHDYTLDVDTILESISDSVKIIFIANPNNPTGKIIKRENLIRLIEKASCLVVIDECYYEFSEQTVVDLVNTYPNLIVLRSFSKGFALAGLRIGYAVMNNEVASLLRSKMQFFCVNIIAQTAAIMALNDLDYYKYQISYLCSRRQYLIDELLKLDFEVSNSYTNFLFVGTKKRNMLASTIVEKLKDRGVYVKDCSLLPGIDKFHFRTSVGTSIQNEELIGQLNLI